MTVRKAEKASAETIEEVHVAVEEIGAIRKKVESDALGGDSWTRSVGAFQLVVRQFRRPPEKA